MATWMVHFRVADGLIPSFPVLDETMFAAGNVAPDCGYGEKDSFGGFEPPPRITHWTKTGRKCDINTQAFFDTYLRERTVSLKEKDSGTAAASFYLGYYVHLLTDMKWAAELYLPTRALYRAEYEKNPEFLRVIKEDWYDLDHKFLRDHPDFQIFHTFAAMEEIPDFLPYYEPGQLKKQTAFIRDFYLNFEEYRRLDRDYQYLTEAQATQFIVQCVSEVEQKLKELI